MDHLKILGISNTPTVPAGEEEVAADADEPPDDHVPDLKDGFQKENMYSKKVSAPRLPRRESLLTRAIQAENDVSSTPSCMAEVPRGLSTTSSHSFASTAELTSDAESPLRSASPSPPPPLNRIHFATSTKPVEAEKIVIAPVINDDKSTTVESGEAALEKSLGRKRCIMFACKNTTPEEPKLVEVKSMVKEAPNLDPVPRKCRISFACPSRPSAESKQGLVSPETCRRNTVPAPAGRQSSQLDVNQPRRATEANLPTSLADPRRQIQSPPMSPISPQHPFHEFASSHDEPDEWVQKASELTKPKLTIDDCMKKELAIRKIAKEAEEEADAEEREQQELENKLNDDEDEVEDDFAPSDEEESRTDDGNESDDEEGFAESDSESDAGSEYRFWAPSATTTRATSIDNMTHFSARQRSRSRASSTSSAGSYNVGASVSRPIPKSKASKAIRMRPGTPELPDSTDFVCGTFDEDRPLEAAYISCREQKRRERHILIPQDIDPSFPTTDPEDNDDEDETAESNNQRWMMHQFESFDDDGRGRRPSAFLVSPLHSPAPVIAPPRLGRPTLATRATNRSPPPKQNISRSPAPRRLFDHPPRRLRSPPPRARLRSPRGSPTNFQPEPFGITINHLAQRPNAVKTSSLPHTPNPFFRNWRNGSQPVSRITSRDVTPGVEDSHPDLHIRGPVDIVIGLEKKREKRKEKFWRQHCRKAAKEQAERRPPRGKGVERMKELGLECAERTRGYGLGQPAQLVLSL